MNLRAKIKQGSANTRLSVIPLGLLLVFIVGGQAYAQVDQQLNEEDGEVSQVSGESLLASWLPSVPNAHRIAPTRPEVAPPPPDGIEEIGTEVSCAPYLVCGISIATTGGFYADGVTRYRPWSLVFEIAVDADNTVRWVYEGEFNSSSLRRGQNGKVFIIFDGTPLVDGGPLQRWRL